MYLIFPICVGSHTANMGSPVT